MSLREPIHDILDFAMDTANLITCIQFFHPVWFVLVKKDYSSSYSSVFRSMFSAEQDGGIVVFHFPSFISLSFSLNLEQFALYPMKTPETFRQEYQSPILRIIPMSLENAICDSTIPGGNEDIGYEDWD